MKQIMITIVAMLLLSTAAMAQDNQAKRPERQKVDIKEMIQKRTDELVKKYALNEEQAKQLLSLNTKFADKMKPRGPRPNGMRRGNRGPRPQGDSLRHQRPQRQQRDKMDKEMKAYEEELQKIMTKDQYKAYKADEDQRRKQFERQRVSAGRRGSGSGGRRGSGAGGQHNSGDQQQKQTDQQQKQTDQQQKQTDQQQKQTNEQAS